MRLHYYPETDSLYIELQMVAGVDKREIDDGIIADVAADGSVVGIDLDRASRFDLTTLETGGLPAVTRHAA
ncbi:DUF2283 domain-containing protein [Sphingomonas bacterium]|uniref:DUF2283 domain-containing protein n=1 Tax=Sphingomonas bacterium TaxID=1895847 RepID=UPI0015754B6B|nr:DUF2283 domain-containing protein [Sphingomonas bacterium]